MVSHKGGLGMGQYEVGEVPHNGIYLDIQVVQNLVVASIINHLYGVSVCDIIKEVYHT